jgi:hypothetical protein
MHLGTVQAVSFSADPNHGRFPPPKENPVTQGGGAGKAGYDCADAKIPFVRGSNNYPHPPLPAAKKKGKGRFYFDRSTKFAPEQIIVIEVTGPLPHDNLISVRLSQPRRV